MLENSHSTPASWSASFLKSIKLRITHFQNAPQILFLLVIRRSAFQLLAQTLNLAVVGINFNTHFSGLRLQAMYCLQLFTEKRIQKTAKHQMVSRWQKLRKNV